MTPPSLTELMQWYDGEISDPVRRREIEAWVASNQESRGQIDALQTLSVLVRDADSETTKNFDIAGDILAAIEKEPVSAAVPKRSHHVEAQPVANNVVSLTSRAVQRKPSPLPRNRVIALSTLAAAAAALVWWMSGSHPNQPVALPHAQVGSGQQITLPSLPEPSATQVTPADDEPTAALSGPVVDSVEFGDNRSGTVFYVEGGAVGTAVLWVNDED